MGTKMLSGQEKLERLDKLSSYVCKATAVAVIVSVVLGLAGVFHKELFISTCAGVIVAFLVAAAAGAVKWALWKVENYILDRIWGD